MIFFPHNFINLDFDVKERQNLEWNKYELAIKSFKLLVSWDVLLEGCEQCLESDACSGQIMANLEYFLISYWPVLIEASITHKKCAMMSTLWPFYFVTVFIQITICKAFLLCDVTRDAIHSYQCENERQYLNKADHDTGYHELWWGTFLTF